MQAFITKLPARHPIGTHLPEHPLASHLPEPSLDGGSIELFNTLMDLTDWNDGQPLTIVLPSDYPGGLSVLGIQDAIDKYGFLTVIGLLLGAGGAIAAGSIASSFTPSDTSQTPLGSGEGPIYVNVVNAETIGADAVQTVADAVNKGITSSVAAVGNQTQQVVSDIADSQKALADALDKTVQNGINGITDSIETANKTTLQLIASTFNDIWLKVQAALTAVSTAISGIIKPINDIVTGFTSVIKQFNDTIFQPIATLINSSISTVTNLTTAIETDLKNGLSGILQIPTDIANSLVSLDATLNRTVQQLGEKNLATSKSVVDYSAVVLPGAYGTAYRDLLGGKPDPNQITTTFAQNVILSEESITQVSAEAVSAIGGILNEVLSKLWDSTKEGWNKAHMDWSLPEHVFKGLLDGLVSIAVMLTAMTATIKPLIDAAEEEAYKRIPITKLDPATVIDAYKRGFLGDLAATSELRTKGFDDTRIQVLKDLSKALLDVPTIIDWWYRGIVSDDDLLANLQQQGYLAQDVKAFKEGTTYLPTTQDITRWYHFGLITVDDATALMKKLRYDDAQITAYLATEQTRETAAGYAQMQGRLDASDAGWLNQTFKIATPDPVIKAGAREGLHPETTLLVWQAHWQLPSYLTTIQAYFRGLRTLTEVQYAMKAENIPQELWDDLVQINRPLIPFRSVPSYVKAGILTEEQGRIILQHHGYDTETALTILKFATLSGSKTASTTANTLHAESVATARTMFADGVIDETQYTAILEAHNFTPELAAAQIQVDKIKNEATHRKQETSDALAQVEAGQITLDQATSQLIQAGLSNTEVAQFQAKAAKAMRLTVKQPSLAELEKFYKAAVITNDDMLSGIKALGWQEPWVSRWMSLLTTPQPVGSPTPSTP